jgi:hypothetical protein
MIFSTVSAPTPDECSYRLKEYKRTLKTKTLPEYMIISPPRRYQDQWIINVILLDKLSQRRLFSEAA